MQIGDLQIVLFQIIRQVFRHLDGQGRDQHALVGRDAVMDFIQQIVDLTARRPHCDFRVQQAGRTDDLFDDLAVDFFQLVITRRCGNINCLINECFKFFKAHRPVIQRARQTEAVFHQRFLARPVAVIHAADLRQRDVRLVDDQ